MRVGLGYDIHRLKAGDGLRIGGVEVPCALAFEAHSDGDPLLHALVDAILGAAARGDIGDLFPDTDPKWKGCDSTVFVDAARRMLRESGFCVGNVDCTVFLEQPKLGPLKRTIAAHVAGLLNLDADCVNVKAKTLEGLGPLGHAQAVAAQVVVMLKKK